MNLKQFLKGTFLFTISQSLVQVVGLIRNALIGHAVSPSDFGIAAVFALILSLVESLSEFSAEKLILQYKFGNNERVLANVHFFNLIKGIFSFVLILIIQPLILFFFELGDAAWGLYVVSLIPIIKGFANVDYIKQQRVLKFKYNIITELGGQLAALLTVIFVLHYYADYRAALFSILAQSIFFTLLSHIVSSSRYKVIFNKSLSFKLLSFGWPLLLNGIALFLILQGDKFIISKIFDMEKLGLYSALSILAFIPVVIATKVLMSTLIPIYSRKNIPVSSFYECFPIIICFGYLIFTMLLEDIIISLVFGVQYLNQGIIFKLLVIMWFFRLLQTKMVIKYIASGDTRTPLKATLIRLVFVPISILFVIIEPKVASVVLAGVIGEVSALLYLLIFEKNKKGKINDPL